MMKKGIVFCLLLATLLAFPVMAEDDIRLPAPQKSGGMPLLDALNARKTSRQTQGNVPTAQQLADVLWAANGVTRPDGKRTAPSAMNRQEIEIAVLTQEGLFEWDADDNELERISTTVALSDQLNGASMLLIFTYDDDDQAPAYAQVDCGFVGQNVYLFCTSKRWDCVFLGSINRDKLAKALDCKPAEVLYGMRIGVR